MRGEKQKMKALIDKTKDLLNTGNKVLAGLIIVPALIVCIMAFIVHLVYYINFIVEGNYIMQIENIKKDKLDAIFSMVNFVEGQSRIIFSSVLGIIMSALTIVSIVCFLVAFYKCEARTMKILMGIELAAIALLPLVFLYFLSEDIVIFGLIVFIVITCFILLFFYSTLREYGKCVWGAILFSYVLVPLVFLLLENIIPIFAFVIAVICIGVLGWLGIKFVSSDSGNREVSIPKARITDNADYYNEREREKQREKEKRDSDRVAQLIREIDELEANIRKHNEGAAFYGTINPDSCRKAIAEKKEELKRHGTIY